MKRTFTGLKLTVRDNRGETLNIVDESGAQRSAHEIIQKISEFLGANTQPADWVEVVAISLTPPEEEESNITGSFDVEVSQGKEISIPCEQFPETTGFRGDFGRLPHTNNIRDYSNGKE